MLKIKTFFFSDEKYEADLWLLNSCTVKTPAEDHFKNEIEDGRAKGIPVVVAGCGMLLLFLVFISFCIYFFALVPQGQPKANYLQGLSIIGVQQIDRVVEVVEETLKGNKTLEIIFVSRGLLPFSWFQRLTFNFTMISC